MLKIIAIAMASAFGASGAVQTHTFKVDPKAPVGTYVDDATLIAAFPSLEGAGKRLGTCINPMFIPASGYISFTPTVTGAHAALENRLNCTLMKPEELSCSDQPANERKVMFDKDPSLSFHVDPSVDADTAVAIARAFEEDAIVFPNERSRPIVKRLPFRDIRRAGNGYEVGSSDCGCTFIAIIEKRSVGAKLQFSVREVKQNLCI